MPKLSRHCASTATLSSLLRGRSDAVAYSRTSSAVTHVGSTVVNPSMAARAVRRWGCGRGRGRERGGAGGAGGGGWWGGGGWGGGGRGRGGGGAAWARTAWGGRACGGAGGRGALEGGEHTAERMSGG